LPSYLYFFAWLTLWPWRWRQYVPLKCQETPTELHGITTQETVILHLALAQDKKSKVKSYDIYSYLTQWVIPHWGYSIPFKLKLISAPYLN
jgi:hypothetical protein